MSATQAVPQLDLGVVEAPVLESKKSFTKKMSTKIKVGAAVDVMCGGGGRAPTAACNRRCCALCPCRPRRCHRT